MWIAVLLVLLVALAGLTALGARRRGAGLAASVVAGVGLVLTWTIWYVRDERPYRHLRA